MTEPYRTDRYCVVAGSYPRAGVWEWDGEQFIERWRGSAGGKATSVEAARRIAHRLGLHDLARCPLCGCYATLACVEKPHDPLFVATAEALREQHGAWTYVQRSKVEAEMRDTEDMQVH